MSPFDVIPVPGQPGHFGVRALVEALVRAGNPPLNSSLRLVAEQRRAWDAYQNGTGSPADDPSRPDLFPLAHVRGAAADIDPTPARIAALTAQGLVRPYPYEPWHWQLPGNVRIYPLVSSYPSPASTGAEAFTPPQPEEEDDMRAIIETGKPDSGVIIQAGVPPYALRSQVFAALCGAYGLTARELADWQYDTAIREQWTAFNTAKNLGVRNTVDLDPEDVQAIADAVRAGLPTSYKVVPT